MCNCESKTVEEHHEFVKITKDGLSDKLWFLLAKLYSEVSVRWHAVSFKMK